MPASPIRKLVPFAEAAKKRGIEVLHLNIGQPDIHSPASGPGRHPCKLDMPVVEYSHSAGFESYRKGLAAYYANARHRGHQGPDHRDHRRLRSAALRHDGLLRPRR
jgi:aspartate/methionine/tyrosine aminotransferase